MADEREEIILTNGEVVKKIKDMCGSYAVENDCPFFSDEFNDCIFRLNGLSMPYRWSADNDKIK